MGQNEPEVKAKWAQYLYPHRSSVRDARGVQVKSGEVGLFTEKQFKRLELKKVSGPGGLQDGEGHVVMAEESKAGAPDEWYEYEHTDFFAMRAIVAKCTDVVKLSEWRLEETRDAVIALFDTRIKELKDAEMEVKQKEVEARKAKKGR